MRFVWASLVVVLCGAHFAAAQEDTDTDAARALFRRGTAQYEQKHYREALTSFEQAKSIKPLPAFDYNIARCHEQLAEWGAAADAYERYVDDARPAPPDAAEIRVRIDHLRQRAAPSPTTPPPSTLPPPVVATAPTLPPPSPIVARHPGRGRIIAGGVVGGSGVLLLALGAVAGVDGDKQADALTAADRANRPFDPSVERKLGTDRAAEIALFTIGAAATAAGAVLVILGARADRRAATYAWRRP